MWSIVDYAYLLLSLTCLHCVCTRVAQERVMLCHLRKVR